jgi:hypothetical protein
MLEILGILVAIGVFVFWCDVTDSWNNVFRWAKTRMDPRRAALAVSRLILRSRAAGEIWDAKGFAVSSKCLRLIPHLAQLLLSSKL